MLDGANGYDKLTSCIKRLVACVYVEKGWGLVCQLLISRQAQNRRTWTDQI